MATLIYGGDVITPLTVIHDGAVLIEGSRITRVGHSGELQDDSTISERIDAAGRIIAPGFIDLQLNGANGRFLTSEPTVEALLDMTAILPRFGCTSVLPTAITAPMERMIEAARAVAAARELSTQGANILGIHLEGPFINPERSGAHARRFIIEPSVEALLSCWELGGQSIKVLTLAPEVPGASAVVTAARRLGITTAIGHTNANPPEINQAVKLGATLATHLFNAMAPLGSRVPGTVGGVLANDKLFVSIIADGVHVHPVSLKVAVRAAGVDRIVLITDAMPPVGTDHLAFQLDGQTIAVRDDACYRPDGVLAGSVLTMDRAVRNMHELVGVSLPDAIAMASLNPARAIGVADRKGSIEVGKDADLVVIDTDINVWLTIVQGRIHDHTAKIPGD